MYKPTGLSREELWQLLFVTKHRANPWQEQEYRGANWREVRSAWGRAQCDIGLPRARVPSCCIDLAAATQGFDIENEAAKNVLRSSKDRNACSLRPDWHLLRHFHDTPSKARHYSAEHREWQSQQMLVAYFAASAPNSVK